SRLIESDKTNADIIALIRGGGTGLNFLDDVLLAETVINCKTCIVSATGHGDDNLLLKKVVDKSFDNPTAFGSYLKSYREKISGEMENSKTVLIEEVKKSFIGQITTLNTSVNSLKLELNKKNEQFDKLQQQSNTRIKELFDENKRLNEEMRKSKEEYSYTPI